MSYCESLSSCQVVPHLVDDLQLKAVCILWPYSPHKRSTVASRVQASSRAKAYYPRRAPLVSESGQAAWKAVHYLA